MNTDISAVISRLRSGDGNCILPETCESRYCQDWRVLEAYIRSLETQLCDSREFLAGVNEDIREFIRCVSKERDV